MSTESELISEIWEMMRDFVPAVRRHEIAMQLLLAFEEYGFDPETMVDLVEEDASLQRAYENLYASEDEEVEQEMDE